MIKPRVNDFIKHEKFMDVAIIITKPVIVTDSGKLKIRGSWVNQAFVETFSLGMPAKITIEADKVSEWLVCMDRSAKCIRDVEWRNLK